MTQRVPGRTQQRVDGAERPTSPCRRGAALDRAWSSPAGGAAAPGQPRRPRAGHPVLRSSGSPPSSHHLQPRDKAALLPASQEAGRRRSGPSRGADPRGGQAASVHAQLRNNRGWRAACHPRKGALIHSRNHGTHPLPLAAQEDKQRKGCRQPDATPLLLGHENRLAVRAFAPFPKLGDLSGGPAVKSRCFQCRGLIPDRGPNTPHALWYGQKKEKVSPFADTFHS